MPLKKYTDNLIEEYEQQVDDPEKGWAGRDLFIRPDLETDVAYERRAVLEYFGKWLGEPRRNLCVVLGDLGTGKSTLAKPT